jgi:hypothetical protein
MKAKDILRQLAPAMQLWIYTQPTEIRPSAAAFGRKISSSLLSAQWRGRTFSSLTVKKKSRWERPGAFYL